MGVLTIPYSFLYASVSYAHTKKTKAASND
jgi:hypothetical protein